MLQHHAQRNFRQIEPSALDSQRLLDEVSWRLLCALQENARLTYSELGRRVGLTPPAVAERIRRLEDARIITGYRVELSLEKLGLPLMAIIRLTTDEEKCRSFTALADEVPEVLECHRVTGADCYILKVAVSSVQHLEGLIDRLSPYGQTTTSVVLSSPITHRVVEAAGSARLPSAGVAEGATHPSAASRPPRRQADR